MGYEVVVEVSAEESVGELLSLGAVTELRRIAERQHCCSSWGSKLAARPCDAQYAGRHGDSSDLSLPAGVEESRDVAHEVVKKRC